MRRVLEIGHGGTPMCGTLPLAQFSRMMPPGTIYHGIDLPARASPIDQNRPEAQILAAESVYRSSGLRNIFLSHMDGTKLAFRDGVFDEVHLHWIVTAPGIGPAQIFDLLQESARVLKRGGSCIISGEEKDVGYSDALWMMRMNHVPFTYDEMPGALQYATVFRGLVQERLDRLKTYAPDAFVIVSKRAD